jgi:hypothetical protein
MQIEGILAMIIPFAGMALAFGIVYVNRVQQTKEQKEMLDRGFSPDDIKAVYEAKEGSKNKKDRNPYLWIGAAAGLLVGHALYLTIKIDKIFAYLVCAFLFAGITLLIQKQLEKKDNH